ncbi:GNAT family N-acetyltransferase [Nocardioides albus]|uniref:Ribosomal protein S18 acetylase RimI-like enzyme n=1 Tax=Nocardioides albus TaxID=1841 RepID=A0A7W5A1F7_9ACTN|nr:GNAT family N-acetyltransferase [Nocardioides albus]MBB3087901.1 ribosomal protein S18 acetylase RimI-like enzyme [Nocardioides albus]GGU21156.1 N-acetyltransferase [Nocardioides albus]
MLDDELADDLAEGRRRPEWMWVAMSGDRLLARASWWGRPDATAPDVLDFFDLDDTLDSDAAIAIGTRLLRTAQAAVVPAGSTPPEYGRYIPPDWRDDPAARRVVESRMSVLEGLGAKPLVERLRLEWRAGSSVPAPSARLRFRSVSDRDELVALMEPVLKGTLDAHSQADLETMSPADVAAKHFDDEFAGFSSPREWWQVAELENGEPVGFVIPARNSYHAIIAYVGVLPAHRGHGYIDDLLGEGTRILAAQDVPRIRASTDLDNIPMAQAFSRAGYINFQRAINMTWS